jgi:hypothetical protein
VTAQACDETLLLGQRLQGLVMILQQCLGTLVLFGHETLDFSVDHLTRFWTYLTVVLDRFPQVLELLARVTHRLSFSLIPYSVTACGVESDHPTRALFARVG